MAASDPTDVPRDVPEDRVDALFGLPADEFIPRRDALAKELRGEGRRDAAAWVKGLRRPSAAAWVVNQLARSRPREAEQLLSAGRRLRDAHEQVLAGSGDADDLRSAAEADHEAGRALVTDAAGFLDREGSSPSRPTLEKVAETIRAVALDDEARAGFEKGRLTRERSASGFGPLSGAAAPRPSRTKGAAPKRTKAGAPDAAQKRRTGARERDAARKALKAARADQRERARAVMGAERELEQAQREAERAQARLKRAAADLEEARGREAEAGARVSEAEAHPSV